MTHNWQADFDAIIRPILPHWRPIPAEHTPGELEEYEAAHNWPQVTPKVYPAKQIALGGMLRVPALLIIPFLAGAFVFVGLVIFSGWGLYIAP